MTEDLDPRIVAALRNVESVDDNTRETHIAAALSELDRNMTSRNMTSRARWRWLSSAAAALVLLAVGTAVGRASVHRSPTEPSPGVTSSTVPPKTGTGTCVLSAGTLNDTDWVSRKTIAGVPYVFLWRVDTIDILRDDSACTAVTSIVNGNPTK